MTYDYKNITTATTTVVKKIPGTLHSIVVNKTVASTITVYDGITSSGTAIATLKASIVEGTYLYDVDFKRGLTIVTAGAAGNITVSYK